MVPVLHLYKYEKINQTPNLHYFGILLAQHYAVVKVNWLCYSIVDEKMSCVGKMHLSHGSVTTYSHNGFGFSTHSHRLLAQDL